MTKPKQKQEFFYTHTADEAEIAEARRLAARIELLKKEPVPRLPGGIAGPSGMFCRGQGELLEALAGAD